MMVNSIPVELLGKTFLTVGEAAAYLCVSKMTVYRLIRSGEIDAVKVGRAFRIRVAPFFRTYGGQEQGKHVVTVVDYGDKGL